MSFLKSLFGAMAANAIRDSKLEEEKRQERAELYDELDEIDEDFCSFLEKYNINGVYTKDVRLLDEGRVAVNAERRKLEVYKSKIKEYLDLGGHASNLPSYDTIDEYLQRLKYIISMGYLDEQDNWIAMDLKILHSLIPQDIEVKRMYKEALAKKEAQERREAMIDSTEFDVDNLSGAEFENVCQVLVEKMGVTTQTTKASGDGGIDLIAYNHQPLLSGKYIIQCKRYTGSVGEPIIRDLYGVIMSERANKGILMTTGHFTKSAIGFAEGKPIELIDGATLKNLMSQYGLHTNNSDNQTFVDVVGNQDIIKTAQEMWELWDETGYEDDYYTLIELKKTADNATDEIKVAEYINWLLEKVDFDTFDICNHSEKIVFWNEVNTYIRKFLNIRSVPKSKLLSYLYQMKFVQNSILLERFTEAKTMFIEMMKDAGIQFNLYETMRETHSTDEIFEHTGVFSFLFATWCNMYQIASISNDDALQEYLNDDHLFYGIPVMQNTRIEDNLELIRSGKSGLNALYFENQQKLIQEIDKWYACEPIQTKIFFRIENIDIIKSFFDYAYYDGETEDDLIEYCTYVIEDGKMVIDYYTTIDLKNALRGYIPFSQKDLN